MDLCKNLSNLGLHLCSLLLSLALTQQQAIDSGTVAAVAAARIYTNLTIAKDSQRCELVKSQ